MMLVPEASIFGIMITPHMVLFDVITDIQAQDTWVCEWLSLMAF